MDANTKYTWVEAIKDKTGKTVINDFIEIVNEFDCKPKRLWVGQTRNFYNKLMQEWLNNNFILVYWTHNQANSEIAERFTKTLEDKIYKTTDR